MSEQLLAIKTDRLNEAWRAKQQLGQPTVVAAGLMEWLRKRILAGGYGCGQKGRGEAKVEVAWDLSCRDGGSLLQILKQIVSRCREDKEWKKKT